jgi:ADP-ribose pyrophosphatase YjhB (NUDIX family)
MIEPGYKFCPQCGTSLHITQHDGQDMQECEQGHILYKNQNVAASGVIVNDKKMLFVRRAHEPQKGWLDFVGGFVNPDEKPAIGMQREIEEELGVESTVIRLLGAYGPAVYPYKGITYYNIDLTYLVELVSLDLHPQDDVASIEWISLDSLPYGKMAFPSQNEFLDDVREGKVIF